MSPRHTGMMRPPASRASAAPRVLIVSDVRLLREGLALALSGRGEVAVVGASEATADAVAVALSLSPNVILVDMGAKSALAFARRIADVLPAARLLALSASEIEHHLESYAVAGFCSFVLPESSVDDLMGAIAGAMRGELICSPRLAASMLSRLAAPTGRPGAARRWGILTGREREIIALVDEGFSNKEIGRRLQISTATVKNHMHHVLEKLQVRRRGQAAARVRASESQTLRSDGKVLGHEKPASWIRWSGGGRGTPPEQARGPELTGPRARASVKGSTSDRS